VGTCCLFFSSSLPQLQADLHPTIKKIIFKKNKNEDDCMVRDMFRDMQEENKISFN
jgi:hypothetical protein